MPGTLSRLPGLGCRHFRQGRCLFGEHRNPGLAPAHGCRVITRLGRSFDAFLERADNLSLTEEEAARLWEARFPAILAREGDCRDYLPGDTNSFPDCRHVAGDLCLLAFPVCPGRCPRYARPDPETERDKDGSPP
jgi:hypothetical protein